MNLTQKLKQSGTALTLAGSLLLGGSGCVPAVVGSAAYVWGKNIEADAARDAAKTLADANQPQAYSQPIRPTYQNEFFVASVYKGDLNGNKFKEKKEYECIGNESEPFRKVILVSIIFNRAGADLDSTIYKIRPNGKEIIDQAKTPILSSPVGMEVEFNEGLPEGTYLQIDKVGNETLGSILLEVKSNLANK